MAWGTQQYGQQSWGYYSICGEISDHLSLVLALLPGQFEESTNLRKLITAFVGPSTCITHGLQEIENEGQKLKRDRWLWYAYGKQLDMLGDIIGETRTSDNDDIYRVDLWIKIAINASQGDPERIVEVIKLITQATQIHYMEKYPARVYIYVHKILGTSGLERLQDTVPAGVAVTISASESGEPFIFGYDRDTGGSPHGSLLSYGDGFGEATLPDEGGDFTEIFVP